MLQMKRSNDAVCKNDGTIACEKNWISVVDAVPANHEEVGCFSREKRDDAYVHRRKLRIMVYIVIHVAVN